MEGRYLVVDLETTGPDPDRDEIIEIGLVEMVGSGISASWGSLVRPHLTIPLRISKLTGITNEMVQDAPELEELLPKLTELLFSGPAVMVGQNVQFDLAFIERAIGKKVSWSCLDTVDLGRWAFPILKNYRLKTLTDFAGISLDSWHRALDDALATAELFLVLRRRLFELPLNLLAQLAELGADGTWSYRAFWRQLLSEKGRIFPDTTLNSDESAQALDSRFSGLFSPEPADDEEEGESSSVEFEPEQIKQMFGAEGLLGTEIPGYEHRPQQIVMAELVCQALAGEQCLLMEAGTGTGKSLAYLIPALYWACSTGQKVVVATHTINLQEQLWEKDLPLLERLLPFSFQAALIKGRNNYLCLRRWKTFLAGGLSFGADEAAFASRVLTWLSATATGDKAELNLFGRSLDLWMLVSADRETCLGVQCSRFQNGCFAMQARRSAEKAQVLIANHSLVFSDIKTENKVLPEYSFLILDEAHRLEEAATEHLGSEANQWTVHKLLNGLSHSAAEGKAGGLLGIIREQKAKYETALGAQDYLNFLAGVDKSVELVKSAREGAREFFALLADLISNTERLGNKESGYRSTLRLRDAHRESELWPVLAASMENLVSRLLTTADQLIRLAAVLERYRGLDNEEFQDEIRGLQGEAQTAAELAEIVRQVVGGSDPNLVCWLEQEAYGETANIILKAAPIQVGQILDERLFREKKCVIMTSATLTVDGKFSHFMERVGLNLESPERIAARSVESPFTYEDQALLCLCRDLPNPSETPDDEYAELIAPLIKDLALVTGGRTLVLFTAHKMLKEVYRLVRPGLEKQGICVLGHGIDGSRARLVEEFKESPGAVLFGASSFWEGVDLPGDILRTVIIVKIPFVAPTIPTVEARLEFLRQANQDSFQQLTLPEAVIRLKQGFGRLIRTRRDHGVVVILDNRLIAKSYGPKFLRSLPVARHFRGERDRIVQQVADWFANSEKTFLPGVKMVE